MRRLKIHLADRVSSFLQDRGNIAHRARLHPDLLNPSPVSEPQWINRFDYNNSVAAINAFAGEVRRTPTPAGREAAIKRLMNKISRGTNRSITASRELVNNIRQSLGNHNIRFGWEYRDPETGLRWDSREIAVTDMIRRERARLRRLPRGNRERAEGLLTEGMNAYAYKV